MDEKYFVAKIQYDFPDENTGKIKKLEKRNLLKVTLSQMWKLK
jgi:hypothetical protein